MGKAQSFPERKALHTASTNKQAASSFHSLAVAMKYESVCTEKTAYKSHSPGAADMAPDPSQASSLPVHCQGSSSSSLFLSSKTGPRKEKANENVQADEDRVPVRVCPLDDLRLLQQLATLSDFDQRDVPGELPLCAMSASI